MADAGAHRGEGPVLGAGGILGVNNLQRAVDTFDHAVDSLSKIVGRLGESQAHFERGQSTGGSWNKFSNWAGGSNGGGASFGGTPFNPNSRGGGGSKTPNGGGATFGGASQSGAHRAPGPTSYGGGGGGGHRVPGHASGIGKAVFAAGIASGAYQSLTQSKSDSNQDSMLMLTAAQQYAFGPGTGQARRMFNFNSWTMNGGDAAAANLAIQQNAGGVVGSAAWTGLRNSAAAASYANPMLTGAQAAQSVTGFYTPAGYSRLRTVGISTIGNKGNRQSITQIANQVLNQVDPTESIRTVDDATALVTDPMSGLNVTLGNWVANGIISGDQVQSIKDQILMILKARAAGVNTGQLQTLLNQRTGGSKSARQKLSSMGIGSSAMQKEKDLAAAERQPTVDRLPSFNKGLTDATNALQDFTNIVRSATSSPGNPVGRTIGDIVGWFRGAGSHGKLGLVGAAGAQVGHAASWAMNEMDNLNPWGTGGSNESRMSVLSMAGGGASSGNPHKAGAAAMGGMSVGGPSNAKGGGGGGGGRQRMHWPTKAHGPITAGFGQSGGHWSSGHHTGIDIGVGTGTPIHAAANGTVIFAGWNSSYGNLIEISHGGGIVSFYGHNSRLVVHHGAHVRQGQLIAYSGATGNVTGPHCHFEIRKNGVPVNPMAYLTGSATVSGNGGSAGGGSTSGGGTAGSGTTSDNGTGQDYTGSDLSGGGGGGGGTIGLSELDILGGLGGSESGGLSGGAAGSMGSDSMGGSGTDTSGGGGGGGTSGGGGSSGGRHSGSSGGSVGHTVGPGHGSGVDRWRGTVIDAMKRLGIEPTAEKVNRTLMQMRTESGGNPTIVNKWDSNWHAGHPSVGLMQVIRGTFDAYAGPFRKKGPFEYGVSTNPEANIYAALNYAVHRYGSIDNAFHGHGYAKGAWDIPEDETAKVHKGEMIIPTKEADQIREILVNGNPYGAMGNQSKGSSGITLEFGKGAVVITVQSSGDASSDGRAIGKAFVDTLTQDKRITALQTGGRK